MSPQWLFALSCFALGCTVAYWYWTEVRASLCRLWLFEILDDAERQVVANDDRTRESLRDFRRGIADLAWAADLTTPWRFMRWITSVDQLVAYVLLENIQKGILFREGDPMPLFVAKLRALLVFIVPLFFGSFSGLSFLVYALGFGGAKKVRGWLSSIARVGRALTPNLLALPAPSPASIRP